MKQTHHGSRPVALLLACGACTTCTLPLPGHLHMDRAQTRLSAYVMSSKLVCIVIPILLVDSKAHMVLL
jgi:hypothetical protein